MTAVGPSVHHSPAAPSETGLGRLWLGVLLPPVSWVADFVARYALVRMAHFRLALGPSRVCTLVALALVLVGAALCWRERAGAKDGTRRVLATWGLGLAAFFVLLILAEAYPTLGLGPGEIT